MRSCALSLSCSPWHRRSLSLAQTQPVKIFGLVELSGTGATSGHQLRQRREARGQGDQRAGGILGRKVEYTSARHAVESADREGARAEGGRRRRLRRDGPVFSGSIMVSMAETKTAEIPNFTGGEAASITQQGNPYIFRTSFTQTTAMPKVARYLANDLKAKSVAIIWVNNDFGKGGRDTMMKELEQGRRQGRRRHLDRSRPGRLLRRGAEGEAVERRRAVRLLQRGGSPRARCASCASRATTSRSSARRCSRARR